jgi:hypothetical protein
VNAFGRLVLLRGFVTEGELEACIFLQRQLASRGENVRLDELLVRKGYLAESEARELLELAKAEVEAHGGVDGTGE